MENTIAVVSDPLFLEHRLEARAGGPGDGFNEYDPRSRPEHAEHPERPERLLAALDALKAIPGHEDRLLRLPPRDATDDELGRVHDPRYVDELSRIRNRRGYLDADTYYAPASHAAATRAAGGCVSMVDALLA